MKSMLKLLLALLVLSCFSSAQAGQKWLFRERLLDEEGMNYMMPGETLSDNCGASGSMGSTTNSFIYVIGSAQYIPTSCYVSWRSADGWTFADIPASELKNYNANITTGYSRRPCTYNLPDQDLSCLADYMIIPRAKNVYAKKMGSYVAGIPLQYIYTNTSGNLSTTRTVNTNSSGFSEFRVPKTFQNGLYCYEDSLFNFIPELSSSTNPTVVVPDKTRPNAITDARFVNNTTLALQWENTASVANVNHVAYVVQIEDYDTGEVVDTATVSSNSAQVYVPLTTNNIAIYVYCYGERNGEALYGFNAWLLGLGHSASMDSRNAVRSTGSDANLMATELPTVRKQTAIKRSPGLLKNIRQYDNLQSNDAEIEIIGDGSTCVDCK